MSKILVVDDEIAITNILKYNLEQENYQVVVANDGEAAVAAFDAEAPDLVLLDLMLPKKDGIEVTKEIRKTSNAPIIIISAKDSELDKVVGLSVGADDYVTKPYSNAELLARIKANLRRGQAPESEQNIDKSDDVSNQEEVDPLVELTIGELRIDPETANVYKNEEFLELSHREFELLHYLARHLGDVLSREQLLEEVWGYNYFGDVRTVDVTIRRLREKIEEDPSRPDYINTRRGQGYYMSAKK